MTLWRNWAVRGARRTGSGWGEKRRLWLWPCWAWAVYTVQQWRIRSPGHVVHHMDPTTTGQDCTSETTTPHPQRCSQSLSSRCHVLSATQLLRLWRRQLTLDAVVSHCRLVVTCCQQHNYYVCDDDTSRSTQFRHNTQTDGWTASNDGVTLKSGLVQGRWK